MSAAWENTSISSAAIGRPLDRVGHRKGGQGAIVVAEGGEHPVHQRPVDEGTGGVLDQHQVGRIGLERPETRQDGLLTRRPTRDGRQQSLVFKPETGIEQGVIMVDDRQHEVDCVDVEQRLDGPLHDRHAEYRAVLFGRTQLVGCGPFAPSGGHDDGGDFSCAAHAFSGILG